MLDRVIRFSLLHRPLILALAIGALVYGGYLAATAPLDVFPDLDRPRVVILTECPGLSAEEVESLVLQPIETSLLGASGVEAVRSQASMALAVTYVEFGWNTEIRAARQVVQERLMNVAGLMPPGVRPWMTPPTSIMGQIMHVGLFRQTGPNGGVLAPLDASGLVAERLPEGGLAVWRVVERHDRGTWQKVTFDPVAGSDPARVEAVIIEGRRHAIDFAAADRAAMELRTLADWVIRPRLLQLAGMAEVLVLGGEKKQYQVLVDTRALLDLGVTLADVEQALAASNLNATGGVTVEGAAERPLRIIGRLGPDAAQTLADLRRVVVKSRPERSVLLAQVAEVIEAPPPKRGDASIDGSDGIVITLAKQPHVDTRDLTNRIGQLLNEMEATLPADIVIEQDLFQLKTFIDRGIYYVIEALVIGAALVVVILSLFLMNLRTTLITLTAIPLSLALTMIAFRWLGVFGLWKMTINVMTLGGLAVAMGELVDDAIVDVENIFRRLRENRARSHPRPALIVVFDASREIRSAIVFGTLVVILVFLPLFFLSGVEGRLFVPLGVAYVVSILASLVVSLTVTPALSSYLLPQATAEHRTGDGPLVRWLKRLATPIIRLSMARAGMLLAATWVLVVISGWMFTRLGADFLPQFDEGSIQLNVALPPGSSLEASNRTAAIIDARLRRWQKSTAQPNAPLLHFVRRTGRAELDEHTQPVTHSEYLVSVNPHTHYTREELLSLVLDDLGEQLPGVDIEAEQPLAHLISHMLSGVTAQVAIKIFGDDVDTLQRIAAQVKSAIGDVPGLRTPVIEAQERVDELQVVLRAEDLAFHGLTREQVAQAVQTALYGRTVSQVREGQRRFDLVLKLADPDRSDYSRLAQLRLDLPDGRGQYALGDVADIVETATGPNQINRENVRRRLVVRCNAAGRDLAGVAADIEARVRDRVKLRPGYSIEYGGQFESQRSATLWIGVLAGFSLIGVFLVLLMLQPSTRIVLQILNAVPCAFIGGVWALVLTGQTLTVASLVGFVSLGGIAVRNGILLVTHYLHLMREEGEAFDQHVILRGSLERLSPVLMTAATAGMALVPIVIGGHKPGLEIIYPVATVILGGLFTATCCEFLIHPGLFWKFSGREATELANRTEHELPMLAEAHHH